MGKRERHFQQIEEHKQRLRKLSTEQILYRLNEWNTSLFKDVRIALREILEERGEPSPGSEPEDDAE